MNIPSDSTNQEQIATPDSDPGRDQKVAKPVKWWLADLGELVLEIVVSIWH